MKTLLRWAGNYSILVFGMVVAGFGIAMGLSFGMWAHRVVSTVFSGG